LTGTPKSRKDGSDRPLKKGVTLPDPHTEIAALTFEQALAELEQIVDKLEKGAIPLEESIALYARGEALKARCESLLRNAEQRIEKITLAADGRVAGTEPLDVE
jgi:exodeoxyribonuclease VII small subunit